MKSNQSWRSGSADATVHKWASDAFADLAMVLADNLRHYENRWLGVPIWQLPADLMFLQDVLFEYRPKTIIETGTKFGGSAMFFSSIQMLLGLDAQVISIDIEKNPELERTLAYGQRLGSYFEFVEANAADPKTWENIFQHCSEGRSLVFLDDFHDTDHVYEELGLVAQHLRMGDIIIVADTNYQKLAGSPLEAQTSRYASFNSANPQAAVDKFLVKDPRFKLRSFENHQTFPRNFGSDVLFCAKDRK